MGLNFATFCNNMYFYVGVNIFAETEFSQIIFTVYICELL